MTPAAPMHHASDRGRAWLRTAMAALALLAAAAAAVSWDAQYLLVRHIKHVPVIAALEAGIPDVGALIFATLGIALALHAKHAVRARTLNIACVGISLAMNALASAPGQPRAWHACRTSATVDDSSLSAGRPCSPGSSSSDSRRAAAALDSAASCARTRS
jgi:hypothetical protein